MKLIEQEINGRLIRLRNLERLYPKARERITFLEKENKLLKQRIKELEKKDKDKDQKIEAMAFQLEQISNKLFGKKPVSRIVQTREKKERSALSYQRPLPKKITRTEPHPIHDCIHCQGKLQRKYVKVFFEEDIPLPIETITTKHEVEVGYCPACKRQSNGYPIPSKKVILGDNVKKYVCILSIANRLSHAQIQDHLNDVFKLRLSMGEIGNMLQEEADKLRPAYQTLRKSVLSQVGTHYDETGWKVQEEEQGKYAWVATGTENNDTVFYLGRSRGKGNIDDIGKGKIGISDDYGAYKNAFTEHQLCWAHPQTKLRVLAESGEFEEKKRKHVTRIYQEFSALYHAIREKYGQEISPYLKNKFRATFKQLSQDHNLDPIPLLKIKEETKINISPFLIIRLFQSTTTRPNGHSDIW